MEENENVLEESETLCLLCTLYEYENENRSELVNVKWKCFVAIKIVIALLRLCGTLLFIWSHTGISMVRVFYVKSLKVAHYLLF